MKKKSQFKSSAFELWVAQPRVSCVRVAGRSCSCAIIRQVTLCKTNLILLVAVALFMVHVLIMIINKKHF